MSGLLSISSATHSSPVKHTVQGSLTYATEKLNAEEMKKRIVNELHCHWVGPMPVESFFKTFLDVGETKLSQMPDHPDNYFDALPHTTKEPELYQPFIDLVANSHTAPTLKLLNTSSHEDRDAELTMKNKPDVTAYDTNANVTTDRPLSYSQAEIIFEFKPENAIVDPFTDLSELGTQKDLDKFVLEATAHERKQCRGQLACYARAWMSRQHRTHCYVIWIGVPYARIIRFDRSGAITTERFDIRSNSRLLLEFLWRISCASPEMRGKDTTVRIVTDAKEIEVAQTMLKQWAPNPKLPQAVRELKVFIGGSVEDPQWRKVLVWGPLADPHCVVGRATRGYPAWDVEEKKLVFVKDSWRVVAADISKETDILTTLNQAEVRNVPTLLFGDDLPEQVTRTQEFADAEWNRGGRPETFSKRTHIRFASNLIGTHLTKFKCSQEFVQAWLDALLAHQEAYEKCGILHRDISLNNILLRPEGGGFLNDWDLARSLRDIESGPRQPHRSGTWQFMSIFLLGEPGKKHTLQDDLEAFFWVLLYVTIRYLITNVIESRKPIPWVMSTIFDAVSSVGTESTGGWHKKEVINERKYIGPNFNVTNNIPLSALIVGVLRIIKLYYQFWINLSDEVAELARENNISLEAAETLYYANNNRGLVRFTNHNSMVQLSREALAGEWPPNDSPVDLCAKDDEKSTKRPAADDVFNDPGSGSERMMKRLKQ